MAQSPIVPALLSGVAAFVLAAASSAIAAPKPTLDFGGAGAADSIGSLGRSTDSLAPPPLPPTLKPPSLPGTLPGAPPRYDVVPPLGAAPPPPPRYDIVPPLNAGAPPVPPRYDIVPNIPGRPGYDSPTSPLGGSQSGGIPARPGYDNPNAPIGGTQPAGLPAGGPYQDLQLRPPGSAYQDLQLRPPGPAYQDLTLKPPGPVYQDLALRPPGSSGQSLPQGSANPIYGGPPLAQPGGANAYAPGPAGQPYQDLQLRPPGPVYQDLQLRPPGPPYQDLALRPPGPAYQDLTLAPANPGAPLSGNALVPPFGGVRPDANPAPPGAANDGRANYVGAPLQPAGNRNAAAPLAPPYQDLQLRPPGPPYQDLALRPPGPAYQDLTLAPANPGAPLSGNALVPPFGGVRPDANPAPPGAANDGRANYVGAPLQPAGNPAARAPLAPPYQDLQLRPPGPAYQDLQLRPPGPGSQGVSSASASPIYGGPPLAQIPANLAPPRPGNVPANFVPARTPDGGVVWLPPANAAPAPGAQAAAISRPGAPNNPGAADAQPDLRALLEQRRRQMNPDGDSAGAVPNQAGVARQGDGYQGLPIEAGRGLPNPAALPPPPNALPNPAGVARQGDGYQGLPIVPGRDANGRPIALPPPPNALPNPAGVARQGDGYQGLPIEAGRGIGANPAALPPWPAAANPAALPPWPNAVNPGALPPWPNGPQNPGAIARQVGEYRSLPIFAGYSLAPPPLQPSRAKSRVRTVAAVGGVFVTGVVVGAGITAAAILIPREEQQDDGIGDKDKDVTNTEVKDKGGNGDGTDKTGMTGKACEPRTQTVSAVQNGQQNRKPGQVAMLLRNSRQAPVSVFDLAGRSLIGTVRPGGSLSLEGAPGRRLALGDQAGFDAAKTSEFRLVHESELELLPNGNQQNGLVNLTVINGRAEPNYSRLAQFQINTQTGISGYARDRNGRTVYNPVGGSQTAPPLGTQAAGATQRYTYPANSLFAYSAPDAGEPEMTLRYDAKLTLKPAPTQAQAGQAGACP